MTRAVAPPSSTAAANSAESAALVLVEHLSVADWCSLSELAVTHFDVDNWSGFQLIAQCALHDNELITQCARAHLTAKSSGCSVEASSTWEPGPLQKVAPQCNTHHWNRTTCQ